MKRIICTASTKAGQVVKRWDISELSKNRRELPRWGPDRANRGRRDSGGSDHKTTLWGEGKGTAMKEIIERLKKEKEESEARAAEVRKRRAELKTGDYAKGKDDGLAWAREAHYDDLKRITGYIISGSPATEEVYQDIIDDYAPSEERGITDMTAWAKGWLDGIAEFWKKVEPHLSS